MSIERGRAYDPWAHAELLGIPVVEGRLREHWGEYRHGERLIVLRSGLSRRNARTVLAHELQHAIRGEVHKEGSLWVIQERRADREAAMLLLDAREVAETEQLHEGHMKSMAAALEVHPRVLEVWLARARRDINTLSRRRSYVDMIWAS